MATYRGLRSQELAVRLRLVGATDRDRPDEKATGSEGGFEVN